MSRRKDSLNLAMNLCPNCSSAEARVVMTCQRANGSRYRRFECSCCTSRWSVTTPHEAPPRPRPSTPGRANYETRRMTDREAALILLSYDSAHEIARKTGLSYGSVWAIRQGKSYQNVYELLKPLLDDRDPECPLLQPAADG